ncbi:MAG: hypothetical protein JSV25_11025 [Spirochaetota bacterium]|nr:MAG: hypothetical protein JSV25_11025 [Spirochaetota bacterium]
MIAAGAIALLYFILVLATKQTLPVPAKEALEDPSGPSALFILAIIGEVLLMPSVLASYFSLKGVKKPPMFIATALWLLCVPMFMASRGQILAISQISSSYLAATDEAIKASYLESAELAIEIQNLYAIMALVFLGIASIIIGSVMLKGKEVVGKGIGYVEIGAGVFTLIGAPTVIVEAVPIIFPIIGAILSAIWQFIVGAKLVKLSKTD